MQLDLRLRRMPGIERKVLRQVRVPVLAVVPARPDVQLGVDLVRLARRRCRNDVPCRPVRDGRRLRLSRPSAPRRRERPCHGRSRRLPDRPVRHFVGRLRLSARRAHDGLVRVRERLNAGTHHSRSRRRAQDDPPRAPGTALTHRELHRPVGKASDWLREERRKVLGDWVAFCLGCGAARRWFEQFEAELPETARSAAASCCAVAPPATRLLVHRGRRLRVVRRAGARRTSSSARRSAAQAALEEVASPEAGDDRPGQDLREADHRDEVVRSRPRGCRAGRGSAPSRRCGGSPGCRARSRAATARRASSPRPCRSRRRRRARAALKRTPQSTLHDHPLLVLARLVAEPDRGRLPARLGAGRRPAASRS